jgi:predicted RNA-binding Zn-ribbon protein involved in translation (DUF1610 family)
MRYKLKVAGKAPINFTYSSVFAATKKYSALGYNSLKEKTAEIFDTDGNLVAKLSNEVGGKPIKGRVWVYAKTGEAVKEVAVAVAAKPCLDFSVQAAREKSSFSYACPLCSKKHKMGIKSVDELAFVANLMLGNTVEFNCRNCGGLISVTVPHLLTTIANWVE